MTQFYHGKQNYSAAHAFEKRLKYFAQRIAPSSGAQKSLEVGKPFLYSCYSGAKEASFIDFMVSSVCCVTIRIRNGQVSAIALAVNMVTRL